MKVLDIETDGLLDTMSTFHCAWWKDPHSGAKRGYRPDEFEDFIKFIERMSEKEEVQVWHNGIAYDIPALDILCRKFLGRPLKVKKHTIVDTLVLSRLLHSNLRDTDAGLLRSGRLPGNCFGLHKLEAWGYRLGEMKGEFAHDFKKAMKEQGEDYVEGMEWKYFSESMYDYNEQDVEVGSAIILKFLGNSFYFPNEATGETEAERFWSTGLPCVLMEHQAQWVLQKMVRDGFPMNREAVEDLYSTLCAARSDILRELVEFFGSWYQAKGGTEMFCHPKTGKPLPKYAKVKTAKSGYITREKTRGRGANKETYLEIDKSPYVAGVPFTPVVHITFNPASRDHIAKKLKDIGWIPVDFTDGGAPKVDDETLEGVHFDDPVAEKSVRLIQKYLMLQKRIGQVAEGDNAWLRLIGKDGRMHGNINPNGAGTGRASHSYPNMAQVPAGRAPYGLECRSAFGAEHNPDGAWVHVGCDASGLELRCLSHFMAKYDGGEYGEIILNGDIHWRNCVAAGLHPDVPRDKHNEAHESARDNAKTFIYGFLYGAGAAKLGQIVRGGKTEGKALLDKFMAAVPAIALLREGLKATLIKSEQWTQSGLKTVWKRKWIRGIDGRQIHVRSSHSALNFLLQGAGAVLCKHWVVETARIMEERGYKCGWDGDYVLMAWVHDEQQFAARTQAIAEELVEVCQTAMRNIGAFYEWRMPLDTEGKIGKNWYECH
ncbi:MAG: DNA polymerase [Spirochaetia bacterium]|nr:DNA polymerase [Spirochaetia bacterium]